MQELIMTGKTVEEAVEAACRELGKTKGEVTFEVIEEPKKKLFGSRPAKVKVSTVDEMFSVKDLLKGSFEEKEEKKPQPEKKAETQKKQEQPKERPAQKPARNRAEEKKPESAGEVKAVKNEESAPAAKAEENAPEPQKEYVPLDELPAGAAAALEYLKSIAEKLGAGDCEYKASRIKDGILFEISGDHAPALIGSRGDTLDAIQYLCLLVSNRAGGEYCRISLDAVGYRARREKALRELAFKTAKEVQRTRYSKTLEPMNPYERRIIHSAIQEVEGVKSDSVGFDPNRRVVISLESGGLERPPRRRGRGRGRYDGRKGDGQRYQRSRREEAMTEEAPAHEETVQKETETAPKADVSKENQQENSDLLYRKIEL
ncbi:MAG: RNA-binding cell elongation regulator Jag/EloR [Oscillospiraceae bacterium]|jgi:spoIIIJ-associated protein